MVTLATSAASARGILTLGGGGIAPITAAIAANLASAQQAAMAGAQASNDLSRLTMALRATQALQSAARNLVVNANGNAAVNSPGRQLPNVANGLNVGGLVPDSGLVRPGVAAAVISWTGATTPTETVSSSAANVTIQQTAPKALLNWTSFNVGRHTTVTFHQQGGLTSTGNNWVAINRITDPTDVPSQILGSIKADGSIYLIDQNGVIFGGGAEVNVFSLVVSALSANPLISTGNILTPSFFSQAAFSIKYNPTPGSKSGDVTIQPGGQITSSDNGRLLFIGHNVTNQGTLAAPLGQVVLAAAADSVYLTSNTNTADTSLRGLKVAVGSGGTAENDTMGLLSARSATSR